MTDEYSDAEIGGLGSGPRYPAPEPEWHCICGSGDNGEWHSLMCVASNTPDEEWYGDYPPRECDHENGECHDIEHQRRP